MKPTFLDFEQPIAELENKIEELRFVGDDPYWISLKKSHACKEESGTDQDSICQTVPLADLAQVARHPQRPYTLDYLRSIFTDFEELHGDRAFADDPAIVGGLARFNGQPVMVIGHQKGRDTKEKIYRNFGMRPGRVSQGIAPDEAGRKVWHSHRYLH
jgi:acetyl-CoA carboxylase carboxyl transferase subunit alpha